MLIMQTPLPPLPQDDVPGARQNAHTDFLERFHYGRKPLLVQAACAGQDPVADFDDVDDKVAFDLMEDAGRRVEEEGCSVSLWASECANLSVGLMYLWRQAVFGHRGPPAAALRRRQAQDRLRAPRRQGSVRDEVGSFGLDSD